MAAPIIPLGQVFTMVQNIAYALPATPALLFTDATTPTIQQSTTEAFTANVAVALTNGQMEVAGAFIRCTTGNISIILKEKI